MFLQIEISPPEIMHPSPTQLAAMGINTIPPFYVLACAGFDEFVVRSGHLWLLLFKKPYCPWCAEFDFEWQAAAFDLRTAPRVTRLV